MHCITIDLILDQIYSCINSDNYQLRYVHCICTTMIVHNAGYGAINFLREIHHLLAVGGWGWFWVLAHVIN